MMCTEHIYTGPRGMIKSLSGAKEQREATTRKTTRSVNIRGPSGAQGSCDMASAQIGVGRVGTEVGRRQWGDTESYNWVDRQLL